MALPLSYNLRSLRVRWQATLFSIVGVALAALVLVVLTAMASGFRIALRSTGRTDNAIALESGMGSELMSDISIASAAAIVVDPRVTRGPDGHALASAEILSLISLSRANEHAQVNVAVRGVTPQAFEVRGGLRVIEGRRFTPGLSEVIVGARARERFGLGVGSRLTIRKSAWQVVGVFASEGNGFESEIRGDLHTLAEPLRRTRSYQAVVLRLADPGSLTALTSALEADPRLKVKVVQERKFYDDQAGGVVRALTGLALFVAVIMGLGAVLAAMNTMYAIVASRTREVGTLRALGLTSATYGANYSELAFAFRTTPAALAVGLVFAALVGILGGLLPALRAARLPIAAALREA